MSIWAIVPARYASSRFPGKALALLGGKPMIQHVWERVRRAQRISRVVIATDDERIVRAVEAFGGEATLTRPDHRNGTERVAEVAATAAAREADIFVNVQGDEPLIDPAAINGAVGTLLEDTDARVSTLATPIIVPADLMNPNIVKVVLDFEGNALYFSRAPIPWVRETAEPVHARHLKHIGLYVFRREALLEFATFPQGELEKVERLEQLRWLENGFRIRVAETSYDSISVDMPDDLARVEQLLRERAADVQNRYTPDARGAV